MRRLVVIHYPFFGGPHNQALRLEGSLRARGVETTVVVPDEPGNAAARLRAGGLDVRMMPLSRLRATPNPLTHARFASAIARDVLRLRRLIRRERIDLVEVAGLVNPHGAIAGRLEGRPVVWQLLDTRPPLSLRRALMPFVVRASGSVMTTGMGVANVHPGALGLGDRLVPFFPPVDTQLFKPDPESRSRVRVELEYDEETPVIGCLANITPQKGLEYFVAATREVARTRPDARFLVLGRTMETHERYAREIHSAAADLVASGRFRFLDPTDRVPELLRALDVFALTAVPRSEGVSTAALEAMATGVPVVTTNVGALAEAVADGVTGIVVPPLNGQAVADAVLTLLVDSAERLARGRAARSHAVARFDTDVCTASHVHAYEIAIGEPVR